MNITNKNSHSVNLIFDKLKVWFGVHTDFQLAEKLEMRQSTLSMQRKREKADIMHILKYTKGIDLNWLLSEDRPIDEIGGMREFAISDNIETYSEKDFISDYLVLRRKYESLQTETNHKNKFKS